MWIDMQVLITVFGLLGTTIVSMSKSNQIQKLGMYSWLLSNALAVPYFYGHGMYYLVGLNVAYAAVTVAGLSRRGK